MARQEMTLWSARKNRAEKGPSVTLYSEGKLPRLDGSPDNGCESLPPQPKTRSRCRETARHGQPAPCLRRHSWQPATSPPRPARDTAAPCFGPDARRPICKEPESKIRARFLSSQCDEAILLTRRILRVSIR